MSFSFLLSNMSLLIHTIHKTIWMLKELRLITALKLCILATKKDGTPLYSDREQYIFSELYGLEGNEIQNMISLGDKLGLSRERIRQLKVKVFKKFGILRKRNIPAIIDIDNLLTNNHQINLDEVHNLLAT